MTLPRILTWAVLTTAFTVVAIPVRADRAVANPAGSAIATNNETLQHSLNRLYAGSAAWRAAVERIQSLGRKAVVVTPRNIRVKDPDSGKVRPFDDDVIAEVQPLAEDETRVDAVVVVVNLDLIQRLLGPNSTLGDLEDDLDRILAHEVYGHAFPYLLAGDLSGKCADPVGRQKPADACAIKRENEVREQLKLGQRRSYGLDGLTLARRFRH